MVSKCRHELYDGRDHLKQRTSLDAHPSNDSRNHQLRSSEEYVREGIGIIGDSSRSGNADRITYVCKIPNRHLGPLNHKCRALPRGIGLSQAARDRLPYTSSLCYLVYSLAHSTSLCTSLMRDSASMTYLVTPHPRVSSSTTPFWSYHLQNSSPIGHPVLPWV